MRDCVTALKSIDSLPFQPHEPGTHQTWHSIARTFDASVMFHFVKQLADETETVASAAIFRTCFFQASLNAPQNPRRQREQKKTTNN